MSYLRPHQWWLRPFRKAFQHQDKDLDAQFGSSCRVFDLRIALRKGEWSFASGIANYDADIHEILDWMNRMSNACIMVEGLPIICRVILERGAKGHNLILFDDFCRQIERDYPAIQFCGFRSKDWKHIGMPGWEIRMPPDTGVAGLGQGDTGAVSVGGKNWSYSCRPASGFRLEYELKDFM